MRKISDITELGEVWDAFWESYLVTGMTPALDKARERLPLLCSMKPETVEAYFATRYDET